MDRPDMPTARAASAQLQPGRMGQRQLRAVPSLQRLALRVVQQPLSRGRIAADADGPNLVGVLHDRRLHQVGAERADASGTGTLGGTDQSRRRDERA